MLSESDSKLYTNFDFCEKNMIGILKTYLSTKPSNYDDKENSKKVYMF